MKKTSSIKRRQFLALSSLAGTSICLPSFLSTSLRADQSPNSQLRVGCIGLGGIGHGDAMDFNFRKTNVTALCDLDSRRLDHYKDHEKIGKGKADCYKDYRHILDRKDIDIVCICTPDHWHVKIALEALAAGKHVFCQKPLTLTIEENQIIRKACRKHKDLVFTVGTQQRTSRHLFLRAINMVQQGLLGDIKRIKVGINGAPTCGAIPVAVPPKELDWEMWQGPAPLAEYRDNGRNRRSHTEFRWWYEYSGGKFTDWGAHHIDIALWAINQNMDGAGPIAVDGTDAKHPVEFNDGYPTLDDRYNTSHDFNIKCHFENGIEMLVTSHGDNGIIFEGTKGRIFVNRGRITGKAIEENWDGGPPSQEDLRRFYNGKQYDAAHKDNFLRCIREGGLPVSDVFTHVQAMNVCHLCSIAARLGRTIKWNPKTEQILDDKLAASLIAREPRKGYEFVEV